MLGIEWKVNDKSPYIDQATQENISKCFHRASNKLKMLSMQFPSFMCRGHRKRKWTYTWENMLHLVLVSFSSCFHPLFILISIINCSGYQHFISHSFKLYLSRVCQIFWSSHSTFFPLAMLVLFMFPVHVLQKKTTFID